MASKQKGVLARIFGAAKDVKEAPKKKAKKLSKSLLPKHNLQDIRKKK